MKIVTILMSLCFGVASAQDTDGWITLFNGADMNGWEMHWGKDWKVENGALACDGSERSWLMQASASASGGLSPDSTRFVHQRQNLT